LLFERNDAVYIANLDGTNEKKLADGIFPAISPDGTRVAFNTVEKTSDTTYVRHMAVVDVATGKVNVFKDVRSENSYYPTWTADGKRSCSLPARTKSGTSSLLIQTARIFAS
jgi:TolB protein